MKKIILGLSFLSLFFIGCDSKTTGSENHFEDKYFFYDYYEGNGECMKTAKENIINIDGVFVIMDEYFVEACDKDKINGREMNKYCSKIYKKGSVLNFSRSLMSHTYKNGTNPPNSEARVEAAITKIYNN